MRRAAPAWLGLALAAAPARAAPGADDLGAAPPAPSASPDEAVAARLRQVVARALVLRDRARLAGGRRARAAPAPGPGPGHDVLGYLGSLDGTRALRDAEVRWSRVRVSGPAPAAEVVARLDAARAALGRCAWLGGAVRVTLEVAADGAVTAARLHGAGPEAPCVDARLRALALPDAGAPYVVRAVLRARP